MQNQATNLLCHSHPPSVLSSTPLKKKLWYSIFELRILLIILKQLISFEYGGSPYNVAIFLVFSRNTSTARKNLTYGAQNAENSIPGLQISNILGGRLPSDHRSRPPRLLWKTSTPSNKPDQIRPWYITMKSNGEASHGYTMHDLGWLYYGTQL
jgi:hypothetical protein